MPNDQKVKRKKQGEHLERNKTKIAIIEFILTNNKENNEPGIPEPKIREYLADQYGMTDQENIRKHLKDLLGDKDKACLEKFPYKKPGLPNYWDITKVEHLSNIKKKFRDIELNKYRKSLMILLQTNGYDIENLSSLQFHIQLLLSSSFFNACIDTNINILCERAWGIYTHQYYFDTVPLKNNLNACFTKYTARYPDFKMSYETFVSLLTQTSQRKEINSLEAIMDSRLQSKMFMKIWEEELIGLSKETLDKMHRETMKEDLIFYSEMASVATDLKVFNSYFELKRFDLLFEHYLYQDILDGVASEEEMEFGRKIKANYDEESDWMDDADEYIARLEIPHSCDLEQASKKLAKDKHPSIFGRRLI